MSKKEIAGKLGVHISTVYREVKRGVYDRLDGTTWITYKAYSPDIAEENYRKALSCKGASIKIGKDFALVDYIEKRPDEVYANATRSAIGKWTACVVAQSQRCWS